MLILVYHYYQLMFEFLMLIHQKISPDDADEAFQEKEISNKIFIYLKFFTSSGDNVVGSTVEVDSLDKSFILLNEF